MNIYFEKFGDGSNCNYLTSRRLYEVLERDTTAGPIEWALIEDDEGDEVWIKLGGVDQHTKSEWSALGGKTRLLDVTALVASLKSERDALANSIDSVNELLDSRSVPKAETLVERVASALTDKRATAGTTGLRLVRSYGFKYGAPYSNPVMVSMRTESGEVVYFRAGLED